MAPIKNIRSNVSAAPEDFEAAFNLVRADIEAVPLDDLGTIKLDLDSTVTTVCGVVRELEPLRESASRLPDFDVGLFDKLRDYALAAAHAQTLHRTALEDPDQFRALADEALALRDLLHADLGVLVKRGLVNGAALRDLRGGRAFKHVAPDIQILVQVFKQNWAGVVGKCATTAEELAQATKTATRLVDALGEREQGPGGVIQTAELRQRAFHLLVRTYDEVRQAVIYLRRREGDADAIVPSLYAGRASGRRKEDAVEQTPAASGAAASGATPGASGAVLNGHGPGGAESA